MIKIIKIKIKQNNIMSWFINLVPWYFFYFFSLFFSMIWCKYKKRKRNTGKCKQFDPTTSLQHKKQWKKSLHLKNFHLVIFFPRKRVVDDEIALLCNTDYDCWFYSTLCIPFLFEKMYTVCIVYYSVKNNTLMYSCWLTTTLSLLSPMIFKQHTGAWNTHNNKKATKNIYFKNRKKTLLCINPDSYII